MPPKQRGSKRQDRQEATEEADAVRRRLDRLVTKKNKAKAKDKMQWDDLLTFYLLLGLIWGVTLSKSQLNDPSRIRDQFLLRDFALLKFLLAAAAMSQLSLAAVSSTKLFGLKGHFEETRENSTCRVSVLQLVLGSCLVGAGMALAQSSPDILAAQLGAGM